MSTRFRNRLFRLLIAAYQWPRILFYRGLSSNKGSVDLAKRIQPALLCGAGRISMGHCHLGVWPSPFFLNGYIHVEARQAAASIDIEDDVWINNNCVFIAEQTSIRIGKGTLIGAEVNIYDSDFHDLSPALRLSGKPKADPVFIGQNVFIGARSTILKGCVVGDNSVIASCSVVTKSIPPNCIAAGVPAKVVSWLEQPT